MILSALVSLYDRLAADPHTSAGLPRRGYSKQNIAFSVVIDLEGRFIQIRDEREQDGKKLVPRKELVPGDAKSPGSGLNPNYFWDQPTYLLGFCVDASNEKKRARATREFESFRAQQCAVEEDISSPEFSAVCRFLKSWNAEAAETHPELQFLRRDKVAGFGGFRILGGHWVHNTAEVQRWWNHKQGDGTVKGLCLVSGEEASIARLHPSIKKFPNASAKLVSFQDPAYASYGKEQSFNAPVSEFAAFKYATALNWLLDGPAPQRLRIGDTTVVYWTERPSVTESLLGYLLGGAPADPTAQDADTKRQLALFLETLHQGGGRLIDLGEDEATPFYILGLAPNAARLSVRFWHAGTLGELHRQLARHSADLAIQKEFPDRDPDFPPVWMLLRETARTSDDIPPLLGGALTRAILTGGPYPQGFATAVLRRIRIDASDDERRTHVTYLRAALLKAFLNRNCQQNVPMSLDPDNPDVPYRLGRLFAALEKTQRDALGDTNTSVRERFYAAASATPGPVFPRILRTYTHHLAKLDGGLKIVREQLIQEILAPVPPRMPTALNLEEQGRFALGYYHQMRAFFTKRDAASEKPAVEALPAA